jgi:hypothetical protein
MEVLAEPEPVLPDDARLRVLPDDRQAEIR